MDIRVIGLFLVLSVGVHVSQCAPLANIVTQSSNTAEPYRCLIGLAKVFEDLCKNGGNELPLLALRHKLDPINYAPVGGHDFDNLSPFVKDLIVVKAAGQDARRQNILLRCCENKCSVPQVKRDLGVMCAV